MDAMLEQLARQAGLNGLVDLRRSEVGPALEVFAVLIADRCAAIAESVPIQRAADGCKDTAKDAGMHISAAICTAFHVPIAEPRSPHDFERWG